MKKQLLLALCLGITPFAMASIFSPLACKVAGQPTPLSQASINPQVLNLAMTSYSCAMKAGYKDPRQLITIIDYTLPSTAKRLWTIDLANKQVLFNSYVAQGKFTGGLFARYFSNKPESKESSLGLFQTLEPYIGHDGYALRINGLEQGFNNLAEERAIVIHGAWYVSQAYIHRAGRLGLSWGCPAVPEDVIKPLINTIKGGTFLFSYYPDPNWLAHSKFLHCQ